MVSPTRPPTDLCVDRLPHPRQRQHLEALAHGLSPVAGVSEAIVAAVHEALRRHELIEVKLPKLGDAQTREEIAAALTAQSGAAQVQLLGRVLVLYSPWREDLPDKPRIELPR
jgi:RNA-binding protein